MSQFEKGQSGDPKGRPPRSKLWQLLVPHAPALISKAVELALDGNEAERFASASIAFSRPSRAKHSRSRWRA